MSDAGVSFAPYAGIVKVFTSEQMRAFDRAAIERYHLSSLVLMENAALRVVEWLEARFGSLVGKSVVIVCGKGNNGGDGLAIARHLIGAGGVVDVVLLGADDELRGDAAYQLFALQNGTSSREAGHAFLHFELSKNPALLSEMHPSFDIGLDAMFGTGFCGSARPGFAEGWELLHRAKHIVAVDVVSGLNADTGQSVEGTSKVEATVTFVAPKRGHFLRDALDLNGELWVGDIGTLPHQMDETATDCTTLDTPTVQKLLPRRHLDAHKGDAGRVLIIGGSVGLSGAVTLASRASLEIGCGLCLAALPRPILDSFCAACLEATTLPLQSDERGALVPEALDDLVNAWDKMNCVALGPGIGRSDGAQELAHRVVRDCPAPLLVDADALHVLPSIEGEVASRKAPTILTPHPGEMGVLMDTDAHTVNDNRFEMATGCAQKYNAFVVLKGARTLIAAPDGRVWVNLSGNPGMATGGAGDVLSGTIAGLCAQLKDALVAAQCGVFLHGLAGDLAFASKGCGLVAGDIAAHLGAALVEVDKRELETLSARLRRLT
ncbi:bifunctional NAD(P)H-hydrate repair enzyme Nnr [Abditibacteriota bacterium]|nr:bifunctional NAD(P)H-hydrate repair enzyme Nnr [Abditibacteriota bacterium]